MLAYLLGVGARRGRGAHAPAAASWFAGGAATPVANIIYGAGIVQAKYAGWRTAAAAALLAKTWRALLRRFPPGAGAVLCAVGCEQRRWLWFYKRDYAWCAHLPRHTSALVYFI